MSISVLVLTPASLRNGYSCAQEAGGRPLSRRGCKKFKESPKRQKEPSNYMQNNFSPEDDTSKVNSKAGEGCYGSQSKVYHHLSPSAFR